MIFFLPALIWMFVLFLFSSDMFSAKETHSVFEILILHFFPSLSSESIQNVNIALRKLSHFAAYAVLMLLLWIGFSRRWGELQWEKSVFWKSLVLSVLYAGFDEVHQSFSDVRTGSYFDVLLDACGSLSVGLYFFFLNNRPKLRV